MRWTKMLGAAAIGLAGCGGGGSSGGADPIEPAGDVAFIVLDEASSGEEDVAIVDNTGTNLRSVVGTHSNADFIVTQAAWNPARTRVAFVADLEVANVRQLLVVDPATALPLDLTPAAPAFQTVFDFLWSDDGAFLAFLADRDVDGRIDLYTVLVGGGPVVLVNQGAAPATSARDVNAYRWQPGTHRLAYVGDMDVDNQFDLHFVDAEGTNHLAIPPIGTGDVISGDGMLEWAPVGNRVAYHSTIVDGGTSLVLASSIYLFSVRDDGTDFVNVSGKPADLTVDAFRWQPGSANLLAYTIGGVGATDGFELRRADADTATSSAVGPVGRLGEASLRHFAYGASGAIVYELQNATNQASLRVSPSGTTSFALEDFPADPSRSGLVGDLRVSPNGLLVAYVAALDPARDSQDLHVIGVDGNGRHQVNEPFPLLPDGGYVFDFVWSPDSTRLLFSTVTYPDEPDDVLIAVAAGGAPIVVSTSIEDIDSPLTDLAFTSDSAFALWRQHDLLSGKDELFLCT